MFQKVHYLDRAELRPSFLNDTNSFIEAGIQALFSDGIGDGAYYNGLEVSQNAPFEIRVGTGHYWRNGLVFNRFLDQQLGIQAENINLINYQPQVYEKALALAVYGEELDSNVKPIDILVDLMTEATEPQALPTERLKVARIKIYEGTEAPQPQVPVVPTDLLHFATVWLQPTGIYRIDMVEENRVPSTSSIQISLDEFLAWKLSVEAMIQALKSELALLWELLNDTARLNQLRLMGLHIAQLKEAVQLPDTWSDYGSDWFITIDESNTLHSSYDCLVDNGLGFAIAASSQTDLALLASSDSSVTHNNGLILPRYTSARRFRTTGYDGSDMPLATEQQSFTTRTFEIATWQNIYGKTYNEYGAWWSQNFNEGKDFQTGSVLELDHWRNKHSFAYDWTLNWLNNWELRPTEHRYLSPTSNTVVGAMIAQTWLNQSSMWLTEVRLNFTKIDTSGDVVLLVVECTNTGEPDLGRVITQTTVNHSNLKLYSDSTTFPLQPAFLWSGKRYALCVVSTGQHRLATVSGSEFTEGSLFTSTSGSWWEGDLEKDLLFELWGAKFQQTRTQVSLQPIDLTGGIEDLKFEAPQFVPEGTNLIFEIYVNGDWHPLTEETDYLESRPDSIPLRAVFMGTTDVQAALELTDNAILATRRKNSLTHVSTERTLPASASSFEVHVKAWRYNTTAGQSEHDLSCRLIPLDTPGGTEQTPEDPDVTTMKVEPDGAAVHVFEFSLGSAIDAYLVEITASRSSDSVDPFVVTERLDIAV